jgi:hypothetical protein
MAASPPRSIVCRRKLVVVQTHTLSLFGEQRLSRICFASLDKQVNRELQVTWNDITDLG